MRIALLVAALIALIAGGLAYYYCSPPGWSEGTVRAGTYTGPPNPTPEELRRLNIAATRNEPLPPGYSLAHDEGTVHVARAGRLKPGETRRIWIATVRAPREDLVSATAYVDDVAVLTVTRETGGIVDRGDEAVATLDVPVPLHAFSRKIEWVGADGTVRSSGYGAAKFLVDLKMAAGSVIDWLTP